MFSGDLSYQSQDKAKTLWAVQSWHRTSILSHHAETAHLLGHTLIEGSTMINCYMTMLPVVEMRLFS